MNKTQKLLIITVVVSMLLAVFSGLFDGNSPVQAISETTDGKSLLNQYDDLPIDPASFYEGSKGFEVDAEIKTIGGSAEVFWHFIDSTGSGFQAFVEFTNADDDVISITLNPYKIVGAAGHYGVNTPKGYKLTDAYLLGEIDGNFNLSHTYYVIDETTESSIELTTESVPLQSETTILVTTQPSETTILVTTQPSGETVTETTPVMTTVVPTTLLTTQPAGETVVETTTVVVTMTDPDIPQTGENGSGNGLLIGLVMLLMAGALTAVVYRSQKVKA